MHFYASFLALDCCFPFCSDSVSVSVNYELVSLYLLSISLFISFLFYRVKNFCGSAGESITTESNILHMRFYAEQSAINSTFAILYTAFREKGSGGKSMVATLSVAKLRVGIQRLVCG